MRFNFCVVHVTLIILLLVTRAEMGTNVSSSTYLESFTKLRTTMQARLASSNKIPPKYYPFQIPIRLNFEPLQIIFVDEVSQAIMVSSSITIVWADPVVGWDPRDYGGIDTLEMETDYFWTPKIYIPKSSDSSVKLIAFTDNVQVSSRGVVSTMIPIITTTLCNLDLTFFPFDTHSCIMVFLESNMYNLTHLELPPKGISFYFGTNAAWILVGYKCYTQTSHYTPAFYYIVCSIEMSRRSAFYVVNLIGPMAMTSAVTLVVFWLPAEGGEKMTFAVSMFLSSSVFYNYILEIMPRSMENPPRLNLLLVFNGILIMLVTAATTIVLRRYERQEFSQRGTESPGHSSHADKRAESRLFYPPRNNSVSPEPAEQVHHSYLNLQEMDLPTLDRQVKARSCWKGQMSYEQLDMIFFTLMSTLTLPFHKK
ncbi:hypothetical protein Btru_053241 [Bulinus truncatus]|nr:hypothetical protein Btru_053241 [Bulinus truncatus]